MDVCFWVAFLHFHRRAADARGLLRLDRPATARRRTSLAGRLRELRAESRASGASRAAGPVDPASSRGSFAFLGDFVSWLGVLRRLQTYIEQANLKYRAADVFGVSRGHRRHASSCS